VAQGTVLSYVIGGSVNAADIVGGQLSGSVTVDAQGRATISVPVVADNLTEGAETMTVSVLSPQGLTVATTQMTVNDTSLSAPSYEVTARQPTVDEGGTAEFVISTQNVPFGTQLQYRIEGIDQADLQAPGALTGSVTVQAYSGPVPAVFPLPAQFINRGEAVIRVPIAADNRTEGPETMTVSVLSPQGFDLGSAQTVINDTSTTPRPTAQFSAQMPTVDEGQQAVFTLTATNLPQGTVLGWRLESELGGFFLGSGQVTADDIVGGLGSGQLFLSPPSAQGQSTAVLNIGLVADQKTEGDEQLVVLLEGLPEEIGPLRAVVTVRDTSRAPSANRIEGTERGELLNGTSGVDQINARGGNDTIVGSAGADTIDGGAGLDLVRYNSSSVSASLSKNDAGEIFVRRGSETDTLINVERLQFTDQWVAIDLNGNAGVAGRMIVAAFGRQALKDFTGIGISLVDQGWSSGQLAELIVRVGLVPTQSNEGFVKHVFENVVGRAPNVVEQLIYVDILNTGSLSKEALLDLAANTDLAAAAVEQSAIGLVGLPYQPSLV